MPAVRTAAHWADITPAAFSFDVKLHRAMSRHSAQPKTLPAALRDRAKLTARGRVRPSTDLDRRLAEAYLEATRPLADAGKLSSFLLQLSPAFAPPQHRLDELATLIAALAPVPVAVEFRHRAWLKDDRRDDTLAWLREHGAAFVCIDGPRVARNAPPTLVPHVDAITRDDLAYLRLHGRNAKGWIHGRSVAERFGYRYDGEELEEIAQRAEGLAEHAGTVRVMANNNRGDDAPVAASQLREILGQEAHAR